MPKTRLPNRVLVVDDEPMVTDMLVRALRRTCVVITDPDGQAALDRLRVDDDFALILSDIRMPRLDGFELLGAVRRERPGLAARFAIITGGADAGREASLERSGVPVLYKPFGLHALRALVARYLAPVQTPRDLLASRLPAGS
jgi:CheY-like chemotaxis protein